jgi:hypothetical protein
VSREHVATIVAVIDPLPRPVVLQRSFLMRQFRTPFVAALTIAVAACTLVAATALGSTARHAQRAHASSGGLEVGVGDESPLMFSSPAWTDLQVKIARYFTAYDVASGNDPSALANFQGWLAQAQAHGVQPLVAFYHTATDATKLPSVATYTQDMRDFVQMFPTVTVLQPWNEVNRGNVRAPGDNYDSPSAKQSADYYLALKKVCPTCTIVGLDVLDSTDINATLDYIDAFKAYVGKKNMPHIWGLHNYSETNRFDDYGTKAVLADVPGQLWLTETGGLAQFKPAFPYNLTRQAKATRYMFSLADSSRRITRLYDYSFFGGAAPNGGFDAGLTNAAGKPRPAYCVFYEHVRGMHTCPFKTGKSPTKKHKK